MISGERRPESARFDEAVKILRGAVADQAARKSESLPYTVDSLCRALLNVGRSSKQRAPLIEARDLCTQSEELLLASGDQVAARESTDNLAEIAKVLAELN